MHKTYNKLLIFFAIVLLLGSVYTYFSNEIKVQADDSSLASSSGSSSPIGDSSIDQISQDTAFLATLTSLTRIKIDTSIFSNNSFKALNDNTVILDPGVTGRPNPFAPIDINVSPTTKPASPVVTNSAVQVTDKSAVLNGALSGDTMGNISTYFEYGTTQALGKTTTPAKQSLIGTFVTSVSGLTPNTTYFYRAVGKQGGTTYLGDIVSFNTN